MAGSDWGDVISTASREIDRVLSDIGSNKGGGVLSDTFVKGGVNKFLSPKEAMGKDPMSESKSLGDSGEIGKKIEDIIKRALS
jgi:hypothetical protein